MIFGDIVSHVIFTRAQTYIKLFFGDSIFYSIEAHVYCSGVFHFHGVKKETYSRPNCQLPLALGAVGGQVILK